MLNGLFDFDEHAGQGRLILDPQTGTVLDSDSE